jgi:tetratricopeptide (TPR) repeat protein
MGLKSAIVTLGVLTVVSPVRADDQDAMLKAMAMDAGSKVAPAQNKLFQQSIQSTKESIARETLDVFYRDALEYYHAGKYDEALESLDRIYSIDPYYEDVGTLRETITRLKTNHDFQSRRGILEDYMRKGNRAQQSGQSIAAINFWKQALMVNPSYEPAKRKIAEVNHQLAQKQYEAGYLYYHHGNLDEALDSWTNAITLDPSYKQRGLLLLMSKVQLAQKKDKVSKLAAQGHQQYTQNELTAALQTFQELQALDNRNEEARHMIAKIKIQLGQAAYQAGQDALNNGLYAEAIRSWQDSIKYEYEIQKSQKGIQETERRMRGDQEAKTAARKKPAAAAPIDDGRAAPAATNAPAPPATAQPACPPPQENVDQADAHYREGLTAIRGKDIHRALEELEIASKLNPCDEHIYVAKERARQEWSAASAARP